MGLWAAGDSDWFLIGPLVASWVYVLGALLLKAGAHHRISIWMIAWITNLALAVCALPLWFGKAPDSPPWETLWQPILTGLFSLAGQVTTYLAIAKGDVSIATPVMGLKVLGVTIFVTLLSPGDPPTGMLWSAALLSAAAIALLQFHSGVRHRHVWLTILLSGTSAACYALHDVLIWIWKPAWHDWFLPMAYTTAALLSGIWWLLYATHRRVRFLTAPSGIWIGAALIGAQGLLVVWTIANYGDPTRVNLVFNARGLWSVLAVMYCGAWFGITEHNLDKATLRRRAVGALLMFAAIALAIQSRH